MWPRASRRTLSAMTVALLELPRGGAVLREVTWRERLSAAVHGAALDHVLANGTPPEAGVALTLHARRLIAPCTRRRIAKTLRGVVEATRRPTAPPSRPPGPQVSWAADELLGLAAALERSEPVDVRGVALARELLRDGRGPLYADRGGRCLAKAAAAATAALDPA
jgi:hypothetical protein